MLMTMLLCSEPLSSPALPLCFYNARANQISAHLCVYVSLIEPACVNTAPAGVCVSLCMCVNGSCFSKKGIGRKREK